jgi:uncharacterized protein YceH (UPF0502 family)
MTASEKRRPFANTPEFYYALGRFFAAWSRVELAIDCAIWKARGTDTAEEAHARSARMKFSDRCKELRDLLDAGKLSDGEKVKELLAQIEKDSYRNVFAHSILASDEHKVIFIHRRWERSSREYRSDSYEATRDNFLTHVGNFERLCLDFEQAAGLSDKEVRDFGSMAWRPPEGKP